MSTAVVIKRSLRFAIVGIVGDLLAWPVWWYTRGLVSIVRILTASIRSEARRLNLGAWLTHLGEPMFGQSDWQGRAISVVMRLVVLIFRLLTLALWMLGVGLLLTAWVLLLPLIVWQILLQLAGIGGWGEPYV